jgi:hypothetical protein
VPATRRIDRHAVPTRRVEEEYAWRDANLASGRFEEQVEAAARVDVIERCHGAAIKCP